jgi:hypothetical protein
MADYQFNTNLGPAAQQGTSLGDMINTARGIQAYQQQGQLNPLQLQKAQMEVDQAQKLNPLAVRKATAETGTSELQLSSAQTDKLYGLAGGVLNDPRMKSGKKEDVLGVLHEAQQRAATFGLPKEAVDGVFNPLMTLGAQNPTAVRQSISNIVQSGLGPAGQQALQSGAVVEINGVKYQYNASNGQLAQLGAGGAAPANPAAPAAPAAPAVPAAPQSSSLVRQDMPVPSGGVPQMNTQQTARFEEGQALQKESTSLAQAAKEAKQTSRKIKENIAAAAGSAPGQALRFAEKYIAGNETLDELVKNLADNQMRQAALMGASSTTDQARQVVALANGSENITPQALAQIVQRADATSTALEKFNAGLNKYYEKAGTYNGPIHARNFKQAWAENYDPRIFMVQNINASDMTGAEKQGQIQLVLKGTSEEERRALAKKAETIKRLERGDF